MRSEHGHELHRSAPLRHASESDRQHQLDGDFYGSLVCEELCCPQIFYELEGMEAQVNCKSGDLAILIKARLDENVGMLVRVREFFGIIREGPAWVVEWQGNRSVANIWTSTFDGMSDCGVTPDAWLRPVSGLPITDDIKDEVTA
jgi:hypothetical protein